jgi:hypothetical protein
MFIHRIPLLSPRQMRFAVYLITRSDYLCLARLFCGPSSVAFWASAHFSNLEDILLFWRYYGSLYRLLCFPLSTAVGTYYLFMFIVSPRLPHVLQPVTRPPPRKVTY